MKNREYGTAGVTVRSMEAGDREEFLAMSRAFYDSPAVLHPVDPAFHARAFAACMAGEPGIECLFLVVDGKTAGYALLAKTYSREAGGNVVWIEELYVLPAMQKQGIGTAFFHWLHENRPAARYRLETEPDNEAARALYARLGYRPLPYLQMLRE